MGYSHDAAGSSSSTTSDFDKLQLALTELRTRFGSVDDILEAFGLLHMPTAQRYGIFFGCVVFALTLTAVLTLLTLGGSFRRMQQQQDTGNSAGTILTATQARQQRNLLFDQLLEARVRLHERYEAIVPPRTRGPTALTDLLGNEAVVVAGAVTDNENNNADATKNATASGSKEKTKKKTVTRYIPPFYQENYAEAYRKCQDRPGGAILSGRPESRFEAYARAYAGCGPHTTLAYRRSYSRMYEALCGQTHATDDAHRTHFEARPSDVVGKYVRLEALDVDRHLEAVMEVTCGAPALECKGYDVQEVWGFREDGPFDTTEELAASSVFEREFNAAGFAVVHAVTNQVWGVVLLQKDDPHHLTIQLEPPLMQPSRDGSREQLEACFLLMDRLFAHGYRRLQMALDVQDVVHSKLCMRLGYSLEGRLYKHMVVKEANRDSNIYAILNSDWKRGARNALFKKLYGAKALRADQANELAEQELDERKEFLKKKKDEEEEAKNKNV